MNARDCYWSTYEIARERFRNAASNASAKLAVETVATDGRDGKTLTVDVAIVGNANPQWTVVVSSGLHGVEGFLGSAIQFAWLRGMVSNGFPSQDGRVVLIHAINPYGMDFLRRTNEENVDLNRNFLPANKPYAGSPAGYAQLDGFLNPSSPPSRFEPYRFKALWNIWRLGLPALKKAIVGGQYGYPKGLFFGGRRPAASTRIIQERFDEWTGAATNVVHVDFHSGLGKYGEYKLLLVESPDSPNSPWYRDNFGADRVEPAGNPQGTAYEASGIMGEWIATTFSQRVYRFFAAEFGTFSEIRVLGALRAENRAHFYSTPGTTVYQRAKKELLECFCPRSDAWREHVLEQGLQLIERAIRSAQS